MVSDWPVVPSSTSWWATSPRSRTEWIGMPPAPSPPRAPSSTVLVVGSGAQSADAAAMRSAVCDRGARRRVDLLVVVELDDLGGVEVRRRELGEAHHQHRADREVGHDHRVRRRRARSVRGSRSTSSALNPLVPTTACTPLSAHHVEVLARGVDHGEVDRDLGAGVEERVGARRDVDARRRRRRAAGGRCRRGSGSTAATSSSSGSSSDRAAHRRTHAPAGAEHADPDHPAHALGGLGHVTAAQDWRASLRRPGPDRRPSVRAPGAEHPVDDPGDVVGGDRFDPLDHLVDARDLAQRELGPADAVHAARRALERQRERAGEVALGAARARRR